MEHEGDVRFWEFMWHKMVMGHLEFCHHNFVEWYIAESGFQDLDMEEVRDTTVVQLTRMQIHGDDWLQLDRPWAPWSTRD